MAFIKVKESGGDVIINTDHICIMRMGVREDNTFYCLLSLAGGYRISLINTEDIDKLLKIVNVKFDDKPSCKTH